MRNFDDSSYRLFLKFAESELIRRRYRKQDREDIAQNALIRAMKGPAFDSEKGNFKSYVKLYVVRASSDFKRSQRTRVKTWNNGEIEKFSNRATMLAGKALKDSFEPTNIKVNPFTVTEKRILVAMCICATTKEMGKFLGKRTGTITWHLNNIFDKLDIRDGRLAVVHCLEHGYINFREVSKARIGNIESEILTRKEAATLLEISETMLSIWIALYAEFISLEDRQKIDRKTFQTLELIRFLKNEQFSTTAIKLYLEEGFSKSDYENIVKSARISRRRNQQCAVKGSGG